MAPLDADQHLQDSRTAWISHRRCVLTLSWRVPNANVLWQPKGGYQTWGVPSPNGRYLAILGAVANSNVRLLEGFGERRISYGRRYGNS
jgi:hypothetical protein